MKNIKIRNCSDCPYNDEPSVPGYLMSLHNKTRTSFCYYPDTGLQLNRYKDIPIIMFKIPKWCPL